MTAIRTLLSMAALVGPLSLAATAAAQSPGAAASPPSGWLPSQAPASRAPGPYGPQPYGAPPGYSALPAPPSMQLVALPRTLPYRENQPQPLGYRMDVRPNGGLMVAGSTILVSTWALSALVGGIILSEGDRSSGGYGPLLVPVIGPFITLGTVDDVDFDGSGDSTLAALLIFNGVTQATGLALLVGGIASDQKYWVRNDIPHSASLRPPELLLGPGGGALRFRF